MKNGYFKIRMPALLAALAVTAALAVSGGCGGSGETKRSSLQAYVYGELHGEMAQALGEQVDFSEYNGTSADRMLIISLPNTGLTNNAAGAIAAQAKAVLEAGQIVALEHVNQTEINSFMNGLGMEELNILRVPDENDDPDEAVEIFAMERRGGNNFFFVAMNDDSEPLISADREEREYIIDGPENDENGTVSVKTSIVSADKPEYPADEEIQNGRVDEFVKWAAGGEERLAALKAGASANSAESDLKELAEANVWDINCSETGQTFTIRYTVYSCHSFNDNLDYFLVSQSAQLNPSARWKRTQEGHVRWPHIYEPKQEGHMRRYIFSNEWGENPGNAVPLVKHAPANANKSSSVTSGFSWSASGSVGFAGLSGTGSLSSGVSFSTSQTFTIDDCTVNNNCGGGKAYLAEWRYVFADPANGTAHFYWSELKDAPLLARSNFQPVNQWIWVVPHDFSDKWASLNFRSGFGWVNGKSEGQINCFGIKTYDAVHKDWQWNNRNFWVPLKKPPMLVADKSQMDFTKNGESKTLTFVSAREWKAESSQSWCNVQEKSGAATGSQGIVLHITADTNAAGANREAVVTLKSTDGKENCKLKIFQSQY